MNKVRLMKILNRLFTYNKITKILVFLYITFSIIVIFSACSEDQENITGEVDQSIIPPQKPGVIGKPYDTKEAFEKAKNSSNVVASVGDDINEIYLKEQFIQDAKVLLLSNMLPNEAILKIDNPIVINNFVWEIISARLLYKEALKSFKMFDKEYKEETMNILNEDAQNQFMILKEINLPIKTYQPTVQDKINFYNEKKKIFKIWEFEDYTDIPNFESEYARYYINQVNEKYINHLTKKYTYEIKETVVKEIQKMTSIDQILKSEYAPQTILILNEKEIKTEEFARFLLVQLTMLNAESMRTRLLRQTSLEMEIDTMFQSFIRHNLLQEDFQSKRDAYNDNIMRRFINLYVESRIADTYLRMEVDRKTPPPLYNEVEEFFKENETEVRNYFWRNYPEVANEMKQEERERYIKHNVAELYLRDKNIASEQRRFRNKLLDKYEYEVNDELIETDLIKNIPFDYERGKNPVTFFNN
jgi:hypothetical protein